MESGALGAVLFALRCDSSVDAPSSVSEPRRAPFWCAPFEGCAPQCGVLVTRADRKPRAGLLGRRHVCYSLLQLVCTKPAGARASVRSGETVLDGARWQMDEGQISLRALGVGSKQRPASSSKPARSALAAGSSSFGGWLVF